jgi:hypothetical protein
MSSVLPLPAFASLDPIVTPFAEYGITAEFHKRISHVKAERFNVAIVACATALARRAEELNITEKLKKAAGEAIDPKKIQWVLYEFDAARIREGHNYYDYLEDEEDVYGWGGVTQPMTVSEAMAQSSSRVIDLLRGHPDLIEDVRAFDPTLLDLSLIRIINPDMNCLGLLSHMLNEKISVVTQCELPHQTEEAYEVYRKQVLVKFYPKGIPLGDMYYRTEADKRWGISARKA